MKVETPPDAPPKETLTPEEKKLKAKWLKEETTRLAILLYNESQHMTAEYKASIRHTGGLLTQSMAYAYSKGIRDIIKKLTKENQDEKSV